MKRILVGLDGSQRAGGTLATAAAIAQAHGARLTLLRAVGLPPDVPREFWKSTDESLDHLLERTAMEDLRRRTAGLPPELLDQPACRVELGVAWEVVCDVARRMQATLVVIGSHGYSGLDRLLGTTAAKIVNHAPCSVLVVRPEVAELQGQEAPR
jgi:nucleotide-binding universal stress UspA family protein